MVHGLEERGIVQYIQCSTKLYEQYHHQPQPTSSPYPSFLALNFPSNEQREGKYLYVSISISDVFFPSFGEKKLGRTPDACTHLSIAISNTREMNIKHVDKSLILLRLYYLPTNALNLLTLPMRNPFSPALGGTSSTPTKRLASRLKTLPKHRAMTVLVRIMTL